MTTVITTYLSAECRKCGKMSYIECTDAQIDELDLPRHQRRHMQDIFPDLSVGARELLISGTCDTCWQDMFGTECNDEEEE
jgi:hypothetical protein